MKNRPRQIRLEENPEKKFWSVTDIFGQHERLISCFLHSDYDIGLHAHGFLELNLVLKGQGVHVIGETSFSTAAGDVFVIPPGVRHGYTQGRELDVMHLLLHPNFLEQHRLRLRSLPGYLLLFTVEPHFRTRTAFRYGLELNPAQIEQAYRIFRDIQEEIKLGATAANLAMESLSLYLISLLCRWFTTQPAVTAMDSHPRKAQSLQAVFDWVEKHYPEKITLGQLAEAAHMQRQYFCRIFRQITGVTPMEYLTEYRIQMARNLLGDPNRSVTGIAYATGFYDSAHFSRTFSRLTGMSPRRYRGNMQGG